MNVIAQSSAAPVSGPQLDNRRVLAGLIDLAIVVAGTVAIGFAAGIYGGDAPAVSLPVAAVMTAWALYYYFACESGGGQTLGKKLMRLRVVRVDGRPAEMGDIAVRTVVRILDMQFVYLVGLITMLASGKRRGRLGDLAAGTMVVSSEEPAAAAPAPEAVDLAGRGPEAMGPAAAAAAPVAVTETPAVPELRPFEPFGEPAAQSAPPEPAPDVAPPAVAAHDDVAEPAVEKSAFPVEEGSLVEPAFPVEDLVHEDLAEAPTPPVAEPETEPAFPVDRGVDLDWPVADAQVERALPFDDLAELDPAFPAEDLSELDRYADDAIVEPIIPAGELAELDSLEDEPVVRPALPVEDAAAPEPVVDLDPDPVPPPAPGAETPAAAPPGVEDEEEEPEVVVKSVETVSAIDLVMSEDEPGRDEPEADPSVESDRH